MEVEIVVFNCFGVIFFVIFCSFEIIVYNYLIIRGKCLYLQCVLKGTGKTMTALVGVLNKHAVAIAADSAVTMGNTHKVVNSANLCGLTGSIISNLN